jgi:hypothetical protein
MQQRSWRARAAAGGWFVIGVAAWLLPLMSATGGADKYWALLMQQTGEDLSSPIAVAATPTLRNVVDAVLNTFGKPWGTWWSALAVLPVAAAGAIRLRRIAARRAAILLFCATPYVLFHLAFQETATFDTRCLWSWASRILPPSAWKDCRSGGGSLWRHCWSA